MSDQPKHGQPHPDYPSQIWNALGGFWTAEHLPRINSTNPDHPPGEHLREIAGNWHGYARGEAPFTRKAEVDMRDLATSLYVSLTEDPDNEINRRTWREAAWCLAKFLRDIHPKGNPALPTTEDLNQARVDVVDDLIGFGLPISQQLFDYAAEVARHCGIEDASPSTFREAYYQRQKASELVEMGHDPQPASSSTWRAYQGKRVSAADLDAVDPHWRNFT